MNGENSSGSLPVHLMDPLGLYQILLTHPKYSSLWWIQTSISWLLKLEDYTSYSSQPLHKKSFIGDYTITWWLRSLVTTPPIMKAKALDFMLPINQQISLVSLTHFQLKIEEIPIVRHNPMIVGLIRISHVDPSYKDWLIRKLGVVPCTSPWPNILFCAQVWVMRAVKYLVENQALHCNNLDALQNEAITFGSEWTLGFQPLVIQSTLCT